MLFLLNVLFKKLLKKTVSVSKKIQTSKCVFNIDNNQKYDSEDVIMLNDAENVPLFSW